MTFDPTKNDRVHGCLSKEERAAIEGAQHGWEVYGARGWISIDWPSFQRANVYRAKPAPKLTVSWQNVYPAWITGSHCSRKDADKHASKGRIGVQRTEWSEDGKIHNTYWEDVL